MSAHEHIDPTPRIASETLPSTRWLVFETGKVVKAAGAASHTEVLGGRKGHGSRHSYGWSRLRKSVTFDCGTDELATIPMPTRMASKPTIRVQVIGSLSNTVANSAAEIGFKVIVTATRVGVVH